MKNRDLIRDAMMFAVKDMTGRVLREATVQSMIDDFEKQLTIPVVGCQREQLSCETCKFLCEDWDEKHPCADCAGFEHWEAN